MSKTEVLVDAIRTVHERPDAHGSPEDSFQRIADLWNGYLREGERQTNITAEDVANMMVLLKVARNSEGEYHEDNYVDIAGYAECGARMNEEINQ